MSRSEEGYLATSYFELENGFQRSPSTDSSVSSFSDSSSLTEHPVGLAMNPATTNAVHPFISTEASQNPWRHLEPQDPPIDLHTRFPQRKLQTWGDSYSSDDESVEDMIATYPPATQRFGQDPQPLSGATAHPLFFTSSSTDDSYVQEYFSALSTTALLQAGVAGSRESPHSFSPSSPSSPFLISAPIAASAISLSNITDKFESIARSPPRPDAVSHHFSLGTATSISSSPALPFASSATHSSSSSSLSGANILPHANSSPLNSIPSSSFAGGGVAASAGSPSTVASSTAPNASNPRPASVGPMKIHRRQKSGKRIPPPTFSSELLKAVRLRLDRIPSTTATSSNSSSSTSPLASPNSPHSPSSPTVISPSSSLSSVSTSGNSPRSVLQSASSSSKLYAHSPSTSNSSCATIVSSSSSSSLASPKSSVSEFSCVDRNEILAELPNEVWTRVFSFLPPHSLMELQGVCRSWSLSCWGTVKHLDLCGKYESQTSPTTWMRCLPKMSSSLRYLAISCALPTNEILSHLSEFASLESLSVHCDSNTSLEGLMNVVRLQPKLTKLALWIPPQVRPSVLQPLLPHLNNIHHLKLETMRKHFCERAFNTLESMSSLRILDLSWCKHLNPKVFQRIAKLVALETLILDMCGCEVTMTGLAHLRSLPKLSDLSLKWGDHITDAVLPILAEFPALARLDVSFCKYLTANALAAWLPTITVFRASPHSPTSH